MPNRNPADPSAHAEAVLARFSGEIRGILEETLGQLAATREELAAAREHAFPVVLALAELLEGRDSFTYGHSRRVARYSVRLAQHLGWPVDRTQTLNMAALLHDIGKVIIPDAILLKEGKFTALEFETMQLHSSTSGRILHRLAILGAEATDWVTHHHERWDGTGYPDGLAGEAIPIGARIIALADAYDAMTSSRRYRTQLAHWVALDEATSCGGRQFDPQLTLAFSLAMAEPPETGA